MTGGGRTRTEAYLAHAPWARDRRVFPLMLRLPDGAVGLDPPNLEWLRRDQFPADVRGSPFNHWLGHGFISELRCFLTGGRIYWVRKTIAERIHPRDLPWAFSREHLMPRRNAGAEALRVGNVFAAASWANQRFGHMPLVVKLALRDCFETSEWDRDSMTEATKLQALQIKVDFEWRLRFCGLFPWQPHTYEPGSARNAAERFTSELQDFERQFEGLLVREQRSIAHSALQLDLVEIFRRHLGEPDPVLEASPRFTPAPTLQKCT